MPVTSEEGAVLAANAAFYGAMAARDYAAMAALWSQEAPVACAHPGWPPLTGRVAVMESWAGILRNPSSPKIHCLEAQAILHGRSALVLCFEVIEQDVLLASNLFVKEEAGWRLVHHHAGPTMARPEMARASPSKRLH
jgi:ketosteroid isomerase-like protein